MSSTLQQEKTKMDAKVLANDASNHASIAGDKIGAGLHKAGVALGISERTPGEKAGHAIEKVTDVVTGHRKTVD